MQLERVRASSFVFLKCFLKFEHQNVYVVHSSLHHNISEVTHHPLHLNTLWNKEWTRKWLITSLRHCLFVTRTEYLNTTCLNHLNTTCLNHLNTTCSNHAGSVNKRNEQPYTLLVVSNSKLILGAESRVRLDWGTSILTHRGTDQQCSVLRRWALWVEVPLPGKTLNTFSARLYPKMTKKLLKLPGGNYPT